MQTEKDRFFAVTEDGKRYEIIEMQNWTAFRGLKSDELLAGSTELFTADGRDVSPNSDGSFTIFDTDEVVRRVET